MREEHLRPTRPPGGAGHAPANLRQGQKWEACIDLAKAINQLTPESEVEWDALRAVLGQRSR